MPAVIMVQDILTAPIAKERCFQLIPEAQYGGKEGANQRFTLCTSTTWLQKDIRDYYLLTSRKLLT